METPSCGGDRRITPTDTFCCIDRKSRVDVCSWLPALRPYALVASDRPQQFKFLFLSNGSAVPPGLVSTNQKCAGYFV